MNLEVRRPVIAGNWKMNKTVGEARQLAIEIKHGTLDLSEEIDIVICPPFCAIFAVGEVISDSKVKLGAQDCHWQDSGAFTGEISPPMLADLNCEYVIIGHSERRQLFGEANESVRRKAKALHRNGLSPIICVGENIEEREAQTTKDVVRDQVLGALRDVTSDEMLRTVIAYEPIWAIGTGKTATPEQVQEVHAFVRNILIDLYGLEVALRTRIQYGGSVKPENIAGLMAQPDIDGALVGGASLDASSFIKIVSYRTQRG